MAQTPLISRRRLLASGLSLAFLSALEPAAGAGLIPTPWQSAGPFYPQKIPLDSDSDLIRVNGRQRPAAGQVTHIFGRVLDVDGKPVRGARVEIWQCDAFGFYHHPWDRGGRADPNFQGFGRTVAGKDGSYRFRTIKPVPYPGRTPHIHFGISGAGTGVWTTQMYLEGHPLNPGDGLFNRVADPRARQSLLVRLKPGGNIEAGALAGKFDIVLGRNAFGG
jgi:protocatechuate 3,4-dioxygenase beta subunit